MKMTLAIMKTTMRTLWVCIPSTTALRALLTKSISELPIMISVGHSVVAKALLNTSTMFNYVSHCIAILAQAELFSITHQNVIRTSKITTSAITSMILVLNDQVRENFHTYILNNNHKFCCNILFD